MLKKKEKICYVEVKMYVELNPSKKRKSITIKDVKR